MIQIKDLTRPYKTLEHSRIVYSTCKEYDHISRYRNLRQVVHSPNNENRYITLETGNPLVSNNLEVIYHTVELIEENRLDLIANKYLGSATYSWVIAYFNHIEDGYSISEGQTVIIPKNITDLFSSGEILAPISALRMNLGEE